MRTNLLKELERRELNNDIKVYLTFNEYNPAENYKDVGEFINEVDDRYNGHYDDEESFAVSLIDSCGYLDEMPDNLKIYFDFEAFTRDLFISDYIFFDGYVFRTF